MTDSGPPVPNPLSAPPLPLAPRRDFYSPMHSAGASTTGVGGGSGGIGRGGHVPAMRLPRSTRDEDTILVHSSSADDDHAPRGVPRHPPSGSATPRSHFSNNSSDEGRKRRHSRLHRHQAPLTRIVDDDASASQLPSDSFAAAAVGSADDDDIAISPWQVAGGAGIPRASTLCTSADPRFPRLLDADGNLRRRHYFALGWFWYYRPEIEACFVHHETVNEPYRYLAFCVIVVAVSLFFAIWSEVTRLVIVCSVSAVVHTLGAALEALALRIGGDQPSVGLAQLRETGCGVILVTLGACVGYLYGVAPTKCDYFATFDGRPSGDRCPFQLYPLFFFAAMTPIIVGRPRFVACALMLLTLTIVPASLKSFETENDYLGMVISAVHAAGALLLKFLDERQHRLRFEQLVELDERTAMVRARQAQFVRFVTNITPPHLQTRLISGTRVIVDSSSAAVVLVVNVENVAEFMHSMLPTKAALEVGMLSAFCSALPGHFGLHYIRSVGDVSVIVGNLFEDDDDGVLKSSANQRQNSASNSALTVPQPQNKSSSGAGLGAFPMLTALTASTGISEEKTIRCIEKSIDLGLHLKNVTPIKFRCGVAEGELVGMPMGSACIRYDVMGPALQAAEGLAMACPPRAVNVSRRAFALIQQRSGSGARFGAQQHQQPQTSTAAGGPHQQSSASHVSSSGSSYATIVSLGRRRRSYVTLPPPSTQPPPAAATAGVCTVRDPTSRVDDHDDLQRVHSGSLGPSTSAGTFELRRASAVAAEEPQQALTKQSTTPPPPPVVKPLGTPLVAPFRESSPQINATPTPTTQLTGVVVTAVTLSSNENDYSSGISEGASKSASDAALVSVNESGANNSDPEHGMVMASLRTPTHKRPAADTAVNATVEAAARIQRAQISRTVINVVAEEEDCPCVAMKKQCLAYEVFVCDKVESAFYQSWVHHMRWLCAAANASHAVIAFLLMIAVILERRHDPDGFSVSSCVIMFASGLSSAFVCARVGPLSSSGAVTPFHTVLMYATMLTMYCGATIVRPAMVGEDTAYLICIFAFTFHCSGATVGQTIAAELSFVAMYFATTLAFRPILVRTTTMIVPPIILLSCLMIVHRGTFFRRKFVTSRLSDFAHAEVHNDRQLRHAVLEAMVPRQLIPMTLNSASARNGAAVGDPSSGASNSQLQTWSTIDTVVLHIMFHHDNTSLPMTGLAASPQLAATAGSSRGEMGRSLASAGASSSGLRTPTPTFAPSAGYNANSNGTPLSADEWRLYAEATTGKIEESVRRLSHGSLDVVETFGGRVVVAGPLMAMEDVRERDERALLAINDAMELVERLAGDPTLFFTAAIAIESVVCVLRLGAYPNFDMFGSAEVVARSLCTEAPVRGVVVATEKFVSTYTRECVPRSALHVCPPERWRVRGIGSVQVHRIRMDETAISVQGSRAAGGADAATW